MSRSSFAEACRTWLSLLLKPELSEDEGGALEAAEAVILTRTPKTDLEAVIIADVLLTNLSTGARSDGADIESVRSLRAWLGRDLPKGRSDRATLISSLPS